MIYVESLLKDLMQEKFILVLRTIGKSPKPVNSDELKEKLERELALALSKKEVNDILDKLMPDMYKTYNIRLLRLAQIFDDIGEKKSLLNTLRKYFPDQFEYKDDEILIEKKSSHEFETTMSF